MTGVELIAAERERQIEDDGFNASHDDRHDLGEMAIVASAYAVHSANIVRGHNTPMPPQWPWDTNCWNPNPNPIRNLVKAGALIAAEIDRLQRAALPKEDGNG